VVELRNGNGDRAGRSLTLAVPKDVLQNRDRKGAALAVAVP
jgi:hypothetical protein